MVKVLKNYNLEIDYKVDELIKNTERFRVVKTKSIDQIIYKSDEIEFNDWFNRLLNFFSEHQFENYYFITIEKGNPYLLVKIVDTQSGEIIFCSVTKDYLKITPFYNF